MVNKYNNQQVVVINPYRDVQILEDGAFVEARVWIPKSEIKCG